MARNTVKRCLQADTDQPRRDTRSQAGRFLTEHPDEVRNSFYTCESRCPPLQSLLRETYGVNIPLRTLERFCKPFREAARACLQQQAIHGRYETAPAQQLQIDFGEKVVRLGRQMTRLHFFVCKLGYSRRLLAKLNGALEQANTENARLAAENFRLHESLNKSLQEQAKAQASLQEMKRLLPFLDSKHLDKVCDE